MLIFSLKKLSNKVIDDAESPVSIVFEKKEGLLADIKIQVNGRSSCVFAGLCQLIGKYVNSVEPNEREDMLKLIYEACREELKENV